MARTDTVLETADLLYRASVEPDLWPEALEKFARSVGCIGMAMIPITPVDTTTGLIVSPSMREVEAEYQRGWWRHDSRVGRIAERQLSRGVFCEAQLFEDDELRRDPFRQEFCRGFGIGAFAVQLVESWPGQIVAFSGQRDLKRGHFDGADIEALNWLGPHAARALTLSRRLASTEGLVRGLFEILDRFDGGVFVLNARGEVADMNGRAERLLGDGLTLAKRRLFAANPDRQHALDAFIISALGEHGSLPEAGPLSLSRPSGRKPFLLQAVALRSRRLADPEGKREDGPDGALLLVVDPEQTSVAPHECLRLLGLTAAEARLAALVGSGMRRREAADILGISESTARDTLKHVYSKLSIRTQGELVRLVDRVAVVERRRAVRGGSARFAS